jgi:integrase/recombinase XerD
MVDVNDPHNFDSRLNSTLCLIREDSEIDPVTTEALEEFVKAQREGVVPDDNELAVSTLTTYLKGLKKIAKGVDEPLTEAADDEIGQRLDYISRAYAAGTHNNALLALYAFSDYHDLGLRGEWEAVDREKSKVDVDRLLTDNEVTNLLDAGDPREQVMIGILADTGCRVGALCSFRIRDLDLESEVPQLAFNTNAPTKTADGKVLLTWSLGHIETYLSTQHPNPETPNAPVIHKKEQYTKSVEDAALSPTTIRERLKELGEEVGIARDRMKPHNFRHTAVSNWIRQGWNVDDIVHRASWAGPEMLEVYDNVTDEMRNEDIAARLGIIDDEEIATDPSEATIECPRCNTPVRRDANYCPSCSLQMSRAPALEDGEVDPVTADEDASTETEPGVPDDVWADGAGDVLDDVPPEVLMQKLVEKTDVDADDLLDG